MRRALLAMGTLAFLVGCDQSVSDMGDQPKYKTERAAPQFGNGASARPWVAGTVARPNDDVPGLPYAWRDGDDPALPVAQRRGPASGTRDTTRAIPVPITRELVGRGEVAFNVGCAACHGRLGNGQGMIVQRGMPVPPSFHVRRLIDAPDSHFYDVITNGYGAMFGHAQRTTMEERWEIVAYVRALQAAGQSAPADVRATLIAKGDTGHDERPPATRGGP